MPDDFMKQLQLSKQIEQKAKEATKNRRAAEGKLAEAEAELAKVKEKAGNVVDAEELLLKADAAFKDKDYKNSLSFAESSIAASRSRLVNWIESKFGSTRELLSIVQEMGADVAEASGVLSNISEALGKGELDKAMLLSSDVAVKTEALAKGKINELMAEAYAEIDVLAADSVDVGAEKQGMDNINKSLGEGRFMDSVREAQIDISSLRNKFKDHIHKKTEKVYALQALGAGTGAVFKDADDALASALRSLDARDIHAAVKGIEQAESLAKGIVAKGIKDLLASLSVRVAKVGEMGVDTKDATHTIEGALASVDAGDLGRARKETSKAETAVKDLEISILINDLSKWKTKIQIARIVRADLGDTSKEMDAARAALNEGDVGTAIKRMASAKVHLEDSLSGYQEAADKLVDFKRALSKAEVLKLDVAGPLRAASMARRASLQKDFKGSAALLTDSVKEVQSSIQAHYGRQVMKVEMEIAKALKMQGDVSLESEELDKIVSRIKTNEYDVLDDELKKLLESVDLLIRDIAERAVEESKTVLDEYDGPTDKSGPTSTLAEAESALAESKFTEAYDKALEAVALLKREESDLIDLRFAQAERLLAIMKELECNSVMLNSKLSKAKELNLAGDIAGAVRMADEVVHYSTSIIKDDIQKQMINVRKAISISKKKGIDVSEPEHTMKEAFDLLAKDKIEAAYERMQAGMDSLKEVDRIHHEAYDLIADVRALINEAGSKGIEVARTEARLEGAQSFFESGKYTDAINVARLAHHDIERQAAPLILPRLIEECKDTISLGRMMKVNTIKAENMLESAERMHAIGDHIKALSTVKDVRDQVLALMGDALSRDITAARTTLEKDAESGKDISSAELMIEKADSLLNDRQYNDSWRIVELVKSELDQSTFMGTRTSDYIEQAEKGMKDLVELGIDASTAKEVLKQARVFQKQGNYALATELAKKAFLISAETAEKIIEERVQKAEEEAQMNGLASQEMSKIINTRESIKMAVSQHHFRDAMSMIPTLESELQQAMSNRELAKKALESAEVKIKEMAKAGSLPESFKEMLARSKLLLTEGSSVEARAMAERILQEISSIDMMKEARMKEIQSVREDLAYLGDDEKRKDIAQMVDEAEDFLSKLDLERTSLHLRRARAALFEATGKEVGRRFEDLLLLYKIMDQYNIPKPPQELQNVQTKMYDLKPKDLEKLRGEVANVIAAATDGMNGKLKNIRKKVDSAGKEGKPTTASVLLLEKAASLISGEKFPEAIDAMKDADKFIGVSDEMLSKFASGKEELSGFLDKMSEEGIDVSDLTQNLSDLERSLPDDPKGSVEGLSELGERIVAKLDGNRPFIDVNVDFLEQPSMGVWSKTLIKVLNNGGSKARNINVKIGEGIDIRGTSVIDELPAGHAEFLRVEVMPQSKEKVTVKIVARCESDIDHKDFNFESEFDVQPKGSRHSLKSAK